MFFPSFCTELKTYQTEGPVPQYIPNSGICVPFHPYYQYRKKVKHVLQLACTCLQYGQRGDNLCIMLTAQTEMLRQITLWSYKIITALSDNKTNIFEEIVVQC